jgi:hypothetical protein
VAVLESHCVRTSLKGTEMEGGRTWLFQGRQYPIICLERIKNASSISATDQDSNEIPDEHMPNSLLLNILS